MLNGGCFCGFVRYEAGGAPSHETICHCSICRRTSGAPFVAWFSAPAEGFRILSGEPATFRSSDHGTRTFCPRCGTPLTFKSTQMPHEIDVTICSLDAPDSLPPKDQTRISSRLVWLQSLDELPAFSEVKEQGSETNEPDSETSG